MATSQYFSLIIVSALLLICFSPTSATSSLTAYEVIQSYNFPEGLIPNEVTGYNLNATTGKFLIYLNDTCTFTVGSYKLKYESTVSSYISKNLLKELSGIRVKVVGLWQNIVKVVRDDEDNLKLYVGAVSTTFPVDYFNGIPQCD